MLRPNWTF